MKIRQVRAVEGANFFSYKPVIRGVIDISGWCGKTSKDLDNFNQRLILCLPSLRFHTCSRGKIGGFLERLGEGTFPGHILEHIAIELLTLAGEKTGYGKTRLLNETKNEYEVIYQYECKEAAIEAFYMAREVLNFLYQGEIPEIDSLVEKLRLLRRKYLPGPSTKAILDACSRLGIPYQRLDDGSLYQLGYGCRQRRIQASITDSTGCIGVEIAGNKQLTRKLLNEAAIPVPHGQIVESEEEMAEWFGKFGPGVVVKPCQGNQGKGVSLNLGDEKSVLAAYHLAKFYDSQVIIEEHVCGNNYRLLVIGERMAAAAQKIPPMVVGDGKSSIEELINLENQNPLRGDSHENYLTKIKIDSVMVLDLLRQGLELSSVPAAGEQIMLRQSANLSTGSTAEDVTDQVHRDNAELAVYAARVLGLEVAGIDLVIEDITRSYKEQNGKIIEINAAPGLRMHLKPSSGQPRDVGEEIVQTLFPQGNGRIPVISVTGTNGKTTTVRLISKILQKQNLIVGMTSTEGIFLNDKMLCPGDLSGPQSARTILRHPDVQAAVLETARGGILRSGLGYDYADVAVITNISEDHIGQYGIDDLEDLIKLKSLVIEMVKKHSVVILNADDPQVAFLSGRTEGRVIFFSIDGRSKLVRRHLALGGSAVFADRGRILLCSGADSSFVCHLSKIPLTWGGKALHNVQNVVAAVAACWALGYSAPQIRRAICGFGTDPADNLGRLEYYELNGIKVVLDYGHNPAGIRETINTIKKLKCRRIIGCIGLPGDRADETIKHFANEAAKGFDVIYIKEDSDLRGREAGEVAEIIFKQALLAGKSPRQMEIILNEVEAFQAALANAVAGDLIVIFYENAKPLRQIVNQIIRNFTESEANAVCNISL